MKKLFDKYNIALLSIALASCNHPLETSLPGAVSLQANSYVLAKTTDNPSDAYQLAQKNVENILRKKGYKQADNGAIYISIALSERPADTSIAIKNDNGENILSPASKKAFLKRCKDQAYRLSVIFQNISDGRTLYNGSATKRRCDINEEDTMEFLAKTAISDLLPK